MVVSLCRLFLNVVTAPNMSSPFQILKGNAVGLTLASKVLWAVISILSESLLVCINHAACCLLHSLISVIVGMAMLGIMGTQALDDPFICLA
jgi:hypothetical protein